MLTYLIVGINFSCFMFFTQSCILDFMTKFILSFPDLRTPLLGSIPVFMKSSSLPIFDQHPRSVLIWICCFISCFPTDETVDL